MKRQREVGLAEEAEVGRCTLFAVRIHDARQLANVAASYGQGDVPCPSPLFHLLVGIAVRFWLRLVTNLHEPSDVAQQIDMPRVADAKAGGRAVPVQLPFVDHLAQRRSS